MIRGTQLVWALTYGFLYGIALCILLLGNWQLAVVLFTGVTLSAVTIFCVRYFDYVRHPKAFYQNEWGGLQLKRGNIDASFPYFESAISLNPNFAWAYNNRAFVYLSKEKFDEALADYNRAIELKPNFATAYAGRGAVYAKQRRLEDALADTDKANRLKPHDLWAGLVRASAFMESKKYDEAIIAYQTAIRIKPRFVLTFNNLALCYMWKGDLTAAEAAYNQALTLPSKNAAKALIYNNRGYMFVLKGEYEKAFADLDQATRLNPKLQNAASSRAEAYLLLGKYEEALTEFTKSAELKPNNKFAIAGQAISQYMLGQFDTAKRLWRQLVDIDAHYQKADVLEDEFHCTPTMSKGAHKVVELINQADS